MTMTGRGATFRGTSSGATVLISMSIFNTNAVYSLNSTPVSKDVRSVSIPDGYRYRFWSPTACNGGGTGDIQYPGQGSTSPSSVTSVKCYAD
ncbi:hypothetical protein AARAC_003890 [Aspergillus arachidicola]|uniref:Uncharacterized protein n=1 Tax=Aspergillus arachidicola TaxID=656916 RepID=A0A2G7G3Y5_9EURO|nr:hypothetical protein AARAC_003890 [Aspergillus arachidicola]